MVAKEGREESIRGQAKVVDGERAVTGVPDSISLQHQAQQQQQLASTIESSSQCGANRPRALNDFSILPSILSLGA